MCPERKENMSRCVSLRNHESDDAGSQPRHGWSFLGLLWGTIAGIPLRSSGIIRIVAGVVVGLAFGVVMYFAYYYGNCCRNWARFGDPSS